MQTTTPITNAAGAKTYFEKDDYYTRDASGDRVWMGKGAEALGLRNVDPGAFQAVLEGKDLHGNTLVAPASNGEHRSGWDLHFAPSKSVSMVWAFGDEQQKTDMMESHHGAVESVMKYVEENLIEARTTDKGKTVRVATGSMVAARFDHYTSRELDPQLHSHVVVANVTRRKDGQWRAIANEKIFNRELLTALYENELAAELNDRGYTVTMEKHDTGNSRYARIEGIDERIIDHFGKRQSQIDTAIESLKEHYPNASPGELRQMACLQTRQPKKMIDRDVLHASWDAQLESLGYTRGDLSRALMQQTGIEHTTGVKLSSWDTVHMACLAINEQESTFTREEVMKTAARFSAGIHRNSDLEKAFHDLKGHTIVTLDKTAGIYTTREMKRVEQGIVASVKKGHEAVPSLFPTTHAEERTNHLYPHLTTDQRNALAHILTSTDRVIGIQGDAGTGKTTMLDAARKELEGAGFTVRGLAFTGKAAKELNTGAGVTSTTLHGFLPKMNTPEFTPSAREAWFIDEASMVGSKQMSELIKAAEKVNARLVFIGDTKQLQSIEAGRMFRKLQETGAMKTVHMKETLRQKDEDYKQIVADIAVKRIDSAFEKMEGQGKVHAIPDDDERREAIVEEFTSKKDYRNVLVVTPLNKDRNELNARIRDTLMQKGMLKGEEHAFTVREPKSLSPAEKHFAESYAIGDIISTNGRIKGLKIGTRGHVMAVNRQTQTLSLLADDGRTVEIDVAQHGHKVRAFREKSIRLAPGDKIVFLNNQRALGVQNGLTAEIMKIDPRGNVTVKKDNGKEITWNLRHGYNYLDHGYAVTDYKSQGQTSREVIFNANTERTTSFNSFYVAATRGRDNLHVYTNDPIKLKEQVKHEALKTSTLDHGREDTTVSKPERVPTRQSKTASKGRE